MAESRVAFDAKIADVPAFLDRPRDLSRNWTGARTILDDEIARAEVDPGDERPRKGSGAGDDGGNEAGMPEKPAQKVQAVDDVLSVPVIGWPLRNSLRIARRFNDIAIKEA